MKKLLLTFGMLGVFFSLTAAMCETDDPTPPSEPQLKDYTCKCTYVPTDTTQSNIEETTTVKAETNSYADFECQKLKGKYVNQFYNGTCLLQ